MTQEDLMSIEVTLKTMKTLTEFFELNNIDFFNALYIMQEISTKILNTYITEKRITPDKAINFSEAIHKCQIEAIKKFDKIMSSSKTS
jgi:hypothetical protein